jgi:hypothetical protein
LPHSAARTFKQLRLGEVLLGQTAAEIRHLNKGATVQLSSGAELTVAGIVSDALVGAGEIAVPAPALPELKPRYLLVRYRGGRAPLEKRIRGAVLGGSPLRIRGPGETPYFRHGDAVLAPVMVKKTFGEFSYRRSNSREFTQESGWAHDHIVTENVPLLGRVTCHRGILPALRGALTELRAQGLGWLIDRSSFAGCYNPRLTSSLDNVSRHAWGIALDINATTNRYGENGNQDRRLVSTFASWGFTWGGSWLVPDPAHFEYARPPAELQ